LIVSLNQPFLYHGLARTLDREAGVINLHVRDRAALEGPDATVLVALVDAAADRIVAQAGGRRVQLIGHCVDGTLALAVAQRLKGLGHAPDLVSMIDCWAPDANAGLSGAALRRRRLRARMRRWGVDLRQLVGGQIGWTEFLARNKITRPLVERLGRVAPATEAERAEWAVNARLVVLVRSMSFGAYDGPVALFLTAGQPPDARNRLFGWAGRLPADTPIYDLKGWHEQALKLHGVATIAAILGCRLTRSAG
jgi:thioesterase domain-containing protein